MPVYAYYSQMMLIRKEKSIGSFSIYVCAILLISNILRIFFWLTIGYAVNLLFQSIFIIAIMVNIITRSCYSLRIAYSFPITLLNKQVLSKDSGNGRPMSSTVNLLLFSQIFACLDLNYDDFNSHPTSFLTQQLWVSDRICLNEHRGIARLSPAHL